MIIRALTLSVIVFGTTSLSCFAQEATQHPGGANASVVAKGHPMTKLPPDIAEGIKSAGDGCKPPGIGMGMGMEHGHHIMRMLERSGVVLSDDQVEQMTALRSDMIKSMMPRKDRVVSLAGDLKDTLSAENINDDQARKSFADIKVEIDGAWTKFVDHVIAVSHVFTPDQRHKLKIAVDRWSLGPLGQPGAPGAPPPPPPPAAKPPQ